MPHLSPNEKHNILTLYSNKAHNYSFKSLARQFNINGGGRTIQNWYERWNGTPQSLDRKRGSGRAPVLTSAEVNKCIKLPILYRNRNHRPIHYPEVFVNVKEKTKKQISLRTIQRIGKETLGVRNKRTKKRTAAECKPK